jgi:hypothetical protein
MTGTKTFIIWGGMKDRCTNPNSKAFSRYGGRGITFCKRWEDFELFYFDMGPCPSGKSLERIDNNAGYGPENCRWATRREQQNNRRINVRVTLRGCTKTVAEWARETGLPPHTIYKRLKAGWKEADALGIY